MKLFQLVSFAVVAKQANAFPYEPSETTETDGDGIGNNTDNDGVSDSDDASPSDSSKSKILIQIVQRFLLHQTVLAKAGVYLYY